MVIPVSFKVLPSASFAIVPTVVAFTNQQGQPPAAAQAITITSTGVPVDATVAATTVSGGTWLFVTPTTGTTPLTVSVSVNAAGLLPGTYQGDIVVASGTQPVTPVSIPVSLTVPKGGPSVTAMVSAASFHSGPVSPGEIVTIFGSGIGPVSLVASHVNALGALDALIGDTRVYFDGVAAPLIYTSSGQVSAIVPYEVAGHTTTQVQTEYQGVRSPAFRLTWFLRRRPCSPSLQTGQGRQLP